jgi:hypothetical protein
MSMLPCRCWCHLEGRDCRECEVDEEGVTRMPCPVCLGGGTLSQDAGPSPSGGEPCDDCDGTGRVAVPKTGGVA